RRDHEAHTAQDGADGRLLGLGLGLDLGLDPGRLELGLRLDPGPALGLFETELLIAQLAFLLRLDRRHALLLLADAALLLLLNPHPLGSLGTPLRLDALALRILLLLDTVRLDVAQFLQRKQDRVITPFGHPRGSFR